VKNYLRANSERVLHKLNLFASASVLHKEQNDEQNQRKKQQPIKRQKLSLPNGPSKL
jgi:hypothetical protein